MPDRSKTAATGNSKSTAIWRNSKAAEKDLKTQHFSRMRGLLSGLLLFVLISMTPMSTAALTTARPTMSPGWDIDNTWNGGSVTSPGQYAGQNPVVGQTPDPSGGGRTGNAGSPSPSAAQHSRDDDNSTMIIIGVTIGGIVICGAICGGLCVLLKPSDDDDGSKSMAIRALNKSSTMSLYVRSWGKPPPKVAAVAAVTARLETDPGNKHNTLFETTLKSPASPGSPRQFLPGAPPSPRDHSPRTLMTHQKSAPAAPTSAPRHSHPSLHAHSPRDAMGHRNSAPASTSPRPSPRPSPRSSPRTSLRSAGHGNGHH